MIDLPDDTARVNALLGGEVDAIDAVPYDQIPVLQGNGSMVVEDVESGAWRPLVMNMSKPPFDDTRVRQAFRLIANRHELVAQAYAGHGVIAPDLSQRYDRCALVDQVEREQDIEQAKALLTQAGRAGLTVELTTSPINAGVVEASAVFANRPRRLALTSSCARWIRAPISPVTARGPSVSTTGPIIPTGRRSRSAPSPGLRSTRRTGTTPSTPRSTSRAQESLTPAVVVNRQGHAADPL
jgi:hypothetical protein